MVGYLDMDGVVVDFMRGALERHNRLDVLDNYPVGVWAIEEHLQITGDQFWEPLKGHGFWADLQPYPWWLAMLEYMTVSYGDNWYFLTTPCRDPFSSSGKMAWVDRWAPKLSSRVILCQNKALLSRRGAALIDDNEKNVREFSAGGGAAILFPQPWNRYHELAADRTAALMFVMNAHASRVNTAQYVESPTLGEHEIYSPETP